MMLSATSLSEKYDLSSDHKNDESFIHVIQALSLIEEKSVRVIALSGKMASGKDTYGRKIAQYLSPCVLRPYSASLKEEVKQLLDYAPEYHDTLIPRDVSDHLRVPMFIAEPIYKILQEKSQGIDIGHHDSKNLRDLLQGWGTDYRRAQDDLYWIKANAKKIINDVNNHRNVIITDCRFPNELQLAKDLGATCIRFNVSSDEQIRRIQSRGSAVTLEALKHPSETALDDSSLAFDYVIDTDTLSENEAWSFIKKSINSIHNC